jgi:hypothetical protein
MGLLYWLTGVLALICAIWFWFTPNARSLTTALVASAAVAVFVCVALIS